MTAPPPLRRTVSCEFDADVGGTSDVIVSVAVAAAARCDDEALSITIDGRPVEYHELLDHHGTRLHRATGLGPGRLDVRYYAVVAEHPPPDPVTELDRVRYIRPSRYCESDELAGYARTELAGLEGLELVEAVAALVADRIGYVFGSSRPIDGAVATLLSGAGVCRDYAHLVVALLRARDVPARVASVYAPGLSPMDLHAVAEVAVGDEWLAVDATGLAPRPAMVRIATGRDAADIAFLTTTGSPVTMGGLTVVATSDPVLPTDPDPTPIPLG